MLGVVNSTGKRSDMELPYELDVSLIFVADEMHVVIHLAILHCFHLWSPRNKKKKRFCCGVKTTKLTNLFGRVCFWVSFVISNAETETETFDRVYYIFSFIIMTFVWSHGKEIERKHCTLNTFESRGRL